MLKSITRWSIHHPWRVMIGWLILLAAVITVASSVGSVSTTHQDYRQGQSGRADRLLEESGLTPKSQETVHITSARGKLDAEAARAAAQELSAAWRRAATVARVVTQPPSPVDGTLLIQAELTGKDPTDIDVAPLVADVAKVAREHPQLRLGQIGDVSTGNEIDAQVAHDLGRAEKTSFPLTLVVMVAVFGSLIAAGLPVLVAGVSVGVAGGLSGVLSHLVPRDSSAMSMVVLIGMAVGVDYCLFYLKRQREERASGARTVDAVSIAAETSGHAIVTSGVAVTASLAGLFLMDYPVFDSLALSAVSVVLIAVAASLTLLPALLVKLGRWTERLRITGLFQSRRRRATSGVPRAEVARSSRIARLVQPVVRHPVVSLVLGGAIVAALAAPALSLRTAPPSVDSMPPSSSLVRTNNELRHSFPSQGVPAQIVTTYTPGEESEAVAAVRAVGHSAEALGWTVQGSPTARQGVAVQTVTSEATRGSSALTGEVAALRRLADSRLNHAHAVGGDAAEGVDQSQHLSDRMPWALAAVLGVTSVMMAWAFRSVVIGLITCLLNLASVTIALGMLVTVFQSDWGAKTLDFTNTGSVRDWVPMFLFSILVGLSMDYHVFVLSRVREQLRAGRTPRGAILEGLAATGSVVSSAALVMVGVFSIFATLSLVEMKQIGLGLAVAIAVDATLVRLVLLPAALAVMGTRAWSRRDGRGIPVRR